MKNAAAAAKKFTALIKKLPEGKPPAALSNSDPIAALVMSMLMWESTSDKAAAAYERLASRLVDFNELRICMPEETLDLLGPRYPLVQERSQRLRAILRNIYLREHAVSLAKLSDTNRREARKYLETLDGMVPYVAARVLLMCFETHAVPVDEQLRQLLIAAEIGDETTELVVLSNWLATQVKVGDGLSVHYTLQRWVDGSAGGERRGSRRQSAGKRVSRGPAKAASN